MIGKERTGCKSRYRPATAACRSRQHDYLHDKAEKLLKYFGRLMQIEVEVDHRKHAWQVEIFVSAEHKHDFVAREEGPTPEAAMDLCVHKIEQQLRRYKEKVQEHTGRHPPRGDAPRCGPTSPSPRSRRDLAAAGPTPDPGRSASAAAPAAVPRVGRGDARPPAPDPAADGGRWLMARGWRAG